METETTQSENSENQTGDTSTANEGDSKLFTQDEVNKFVAKRVKEVKKQFADYEDLKSQNEKMQSELEHLKSTNKELKQQYETELYTNELKNAANSINLDFELAVKHIDKEKVIFVDGKPTNLKELLQAEIEKFPQLVKKQIVTPVAVQDVKTEQKFSLHKQQNSTFFNGGGLRLSTMKESS